jgi:hypothetical protein
LNDFRPATDDEIGGILKELCQATQRPESSGFLSGFPWTSTEWFQARLEEGDFGDLFLFWYAEAWDEKDIPSCRTLRAGLDSFREMHKKCPNYWTDHLREILKKRTCHNREPEEPFLILVASNKRGPFMILDGNHRAVAILWNATESSSNTSIPSQVWVGLSPDMSQYRSFGG